MIILDRLKKTWECNTQEEDSCSCRCCSGSDCSCQSEENKNEKFVLKENLSDEEIEEIIETEYKDKNRLTIDFIRKGMKKHGNRFSYEKTEIVKGDKRFKTPSNRKAIVTCHVHDGDIEIGTQYFVSDRYNGCFECNHGHPKTKTQEQFEKELHEAHPNYKLLPGEKYVNSNTKLKFHCETHDIDFEAAPANLLSNGGLYSDHHFSCTECAKENRFNIDKAARTIRETKLRADIEKEYNGTYDILKLSMYSHIDDCVKIHCNICNADTEMTSDVAKNRLGKNYILCDCCRKENERIDRENEFKEKVHTRFPGRFNLNNLHYENNNRLATGFMCLTCGREFDVGSPVHFLQEGGHCPCCNISVGETMVFNWLESHRNILKFRWQSGVDNSLIVGRKDYYNVIIDFRVIYNNKLFFIEYSGEQHYSFHSHFHKTLEDFEGQLRRDENIRKYCRDPKNNTTLIEIPYTFRTQDQVNKILDDVILNNKNPNDLITIPTISYTRLRKSKEI